MTFKRCHHKWPQTDEEKSRNVSDCDHWCHLKARHDGPHVCGDGAEDPQ